MPDDLQIPSLTNQAGPGGSPLAYGNPLQIQQAYLQMMRDKQRQQNQQPIRSWTQVAAGILDTAADQIQLSRLMRAGQGQAAASVPGLPPIDNGENISTGPAPSGDGNAQQAGGAMVDEHNGDLTGFIKTHEGFSANSYPDGKQTSIGYGTRAQPGEQTISRDVAEQRLNDEVGKAAAFVEKTAPNAPPPVKHALTDLTYNAGTSWANAGLGEAVRNGDWQGARSKFLEYNHADGKFNMGLYNRRMAMAPMFDQAGGGGQALAFSGQPSGGPTYPRIPGYEPSANPRQPAAPAGAQTTPLSPEHPPGSGAPAGATQQFMPADPVARKQYQEDYQRAQQLMHSLDPALRQQGVRLSEDLQKRRDATEKVTDPHTGQTQYYNSLRGGRESHMPRQMIPGEAEGMKTIAEEQAKASNRIYEGAMGLGNTGAKVANIADGLIPIIDDKNWMSGGAPETRLAIERLRNQLGMPSNAPAIEVVRQGLGIMKSYWQEGMKSNTSVLGEQARLFQSEITSVDPIIGGLDPTNEGLGRNLRTVSRLGNHWKENADVVDDHVNKLPGARPDRSLNKLLRDREAEFHLYSPKDMPSRMTESAPTQQAPSFGQPNAPMPPTGSTPLSTGNVPGPMPPPGAGSSMPIPPSPAGFSQMPPAQQPPQSLLSRIPGPGITANARTGLGLNPTVPPMPPRSSFTSDVTAKARQHPEGLPLALLGGAAPHAAAAAAGAMTASPWVKAILEALGIGTGIAATEKFWK